MKISKLFHWLYAFLMFLPITFLLPTLAYYGFNDNAVAQEKNVITNVDYETNEVSNNDYYDLVQGNVYRYSFNAAGDFRVYCEDIFVVSLPSQPTSIQTTDDDSKFIRCYDLGSCDVSFGDGNVYIYRYLGSNMVVLDFVFDYYDYANHINDTTACPLTYPKDHSVVTYTMSITDSVNQAINDIFDLPMFSWTTNNFIIAPFASICSFFGIASESVLLKYLYYWLTISIVWLVFDVLMFLPLLVHRWIDKARID